MCNFIKGLWETPWFYRASYSLIAFLAALVITFIVRRAIKLRMKKHAGQNLRADTLSKLLRSAVTCVVWFLAVMQILKTGLGVDVTSILAAAGILGVAIGFGAQSLVKDVITGFFLLFENQFSVGENVTVDGFTGIVQELGFRSTRIRSEDGDVLTIPNGAIAKVVNHSR